MNVEKLRSRKERHLLGGKQRRQTADRKTAAAEADTPPRRPRKASAATERVRTAGAAEHPAFGGTRPPKTRSTEPGARQKAAGDPNPSTNFRLRQMKQETRPASLPENAYRELAPGEEYTPIMPAASTPAGGDPYSVTMGLVMAVVFSAAAAFLGLKVGQVFEAAIPIAIIAVGAT